MSYGVWKKRGKNWSSIEIDGMGRDASWQWQQYAEKHGDAAAKAKKLSYRKLGLSCDSSIFSSYAEDDFFWLRWSANQKKKGFVLYEIETEGEHRIFFSLPRTAGEEEIKVVLNNLNRPNAKYNRV